MKNFIIGILLLLCLFSCAKDDGISTGNIYGIITESATAEPMRATGVELYKYVYNGYNGLEYHIGALLLKTVTYDDGHYEFNDLQAGDYIIKVVTKGYFDTLYLVEVENGRTARADMQLNKRPTTLRVRTLPPTPTSYNSFILNGECTYLEYLNYAVKPEDIGFYYSQFQNNIPSGRKITATIPTSTSYNTPFSFNMEATGFTPGIWYIQSYATNTFGTVYGEIQEISISNHPAVKTLDVTNLTSTTATLNGRIEYEGEPAYAKRGFVYSSSFPSPTIDDPASETKNIVVSGRSADFSANIANLTDGATYYVRAYATNSEDTYYGDAVSFKRDDVYTLEEANLMVQKNDISAGARWDDANELCTSSRVNGFSDWRLPTYGECFALFDYKQAFNIQSNEYWTSDSYSSERHYYFDFGENTKYYANNSSSLNVRCVRTIK